MTALIAPIDSRLVLFTPKIAFVDTRYLIDVQFHVYQVGLTAFKAWSQNEKIVQVITPLRPLIIVSSYSFVANSTTHTFPSIVSSSNLTISPSSEDSQGNIVVNLGTESANTMAQFSVEFYSEYDAPAFAYIFLSPGTFIRNFGNGTQQLEGSSK